MADRYEVMGVRETVGVYTKEGVFYDEGSALKRLEALGLDPDCHIAEIELWPDVEDPQALPRMTIIAQADRTSGEWRRVEGELRQRTRAGEARAFLAWPSP